MKKRKIAAVLLCALLTACSSQANTSDGNTAKADNSADSTVQDMAAWHISYWTDTDIPYVWFSSDSGARCFWSDMGVEPLVDAYQKGENDKLQPLTFQLAYVNAAPDCQFIIYLWKNGTTSIKNNTSEVKLYDVSVLRQNEGTPEIVPVGVLPPAAEEGNPGEQCLRLAENPDGAEGTKLIDALKAGEDISVLISEQGGKDAFFLEVNGKGFKEVFDTIDWSAVETPQ